MRANTRILALTVVLAAVGWFAGCNGTIDDEPNVVLEVATMTIPPVTATTTAGVCTFTISNATATFNNKPKNHLAGTTPFNDIVLQRVVIDYVWDDGVVVAAQEFGVGGTVPANGSQGAQFAVVNNTVLSSGLTGRDGKTATLTMTFFGTTVAGEPVSVVSGGSLTVNSCTQSPVGACCTGGGICSQLNALDCQNAGGIYAGDSTSCLTTVCP